MSGECNRSPLFFLISKQSYLSHCDANSYLQPAKEGDTIVIDARTVKTDENFAHLECELRNKATGQLIAKATHTKFIGAKQS